MDPERFARIKAVFDEAVERPASEREELVHQRCGDDAELVRSVLELLRHDRTNVDVLDAARDTSAATSGALPAMPTLTQGAIVGGYVISDTLGIGGFGVVYRATQERPHREVALKLIRPGLASAKLLRRFELEAELLGRLRHPGIAQVYEAGAVETDAGTQPFFAMELVEGEPLDAYAAAHGLSSRQRLELFLQICDAVQHAHSKGVLHRDLKPSNVLVTPEGRVKVLDFGVARATDADIQATTMQTEVGQLIGTVPYMSPEQAAADPSHLDTRSDVYTLGVVLYELMTGRLPYSMEQRQLYEAVRVIREEEPTRLSVLDKSLRGDVETIVGKALEKEPDRRYQSASDFGADVRRFLSDEPIIARPPSTLYQIRKFARRNTALVGGIAATFVVLIAGIIATGWQAYAATVARDEARSNLALAEERESEAERVAAFQAEMLTNIDAEKMGRDVLDLLRTEVRQALSNRSVDDAALEASLQELDRLTAGINATNV
ncbi:MAG: serine/threonine-protein kinase, partial [Planctomycetota bacterium]